MARSYLVPLLSTMANVVYTSPVTYFMRALRTTFAILVSCGIALTAFVFLQRDEPPPRARVSETEEETAAVAEPAAEFDGGSVRVEDHTVSRSGGRSEIGYIDVGLPEEAVVFGIGIGETFKAYPQDFLPVGLMNDSVAGVFLTITKNEEGRVLMFSGLANTPFPYEEMSWSSWRNLHPTTLLFP